MWGWKPVERQIETEVAIGNARTILKDTGFNEHICTDSYVLFKREGSKLVSAGEEAPLELALAKTDSGLFMQLRYAAFLLFDTGDLSKLADRIVDQLS